MKDSVKADKRSEWEIKEDISCIKRVKEIILDKSRIKEIQDFIKDKKTLEDSIEDGDIAKALGFSEM